MKKAQFLLVLLLFLLNACSRNDAFLNNLEKAEGLLFSNPDSTLRIIRDLKQSNSPNVILKAKIRALELNALYRTYQLDTINSELYFLLNFFQNKNLKNEEGQISYLIGSIKNNLGAQDSAIYYFKNAYTKISGLNNDYFLGLLSFYLGDLYMNKEYYDNSLNCYLKSKLKFESLKDTSHLAFLYSRIAEIHNQIQSPKDTLYFYANKSVEFANKSVDKRILFYNILKMGEYLYPERVKASKEYLLDIHKKGYKYNRLYLLLAQDYIFESNIDSARYYIDLINSEFTDINDNLNLSIIKSRIFEKENKINLAYSFLQKSYILRDSINSKNLSSKVREIDRKLDYSNFEKENLELKITKKNNQIMGSYILGLFIILIVFFIFVNFKHKRDEFFIQKELEHSTEINNQKKILFYNNISNHFKNFARIKELKDISNNKKKLDEVLSDMIEKFAITDSNWENIISEFNQVYENKITKIKDEYPLITKNDLITIILICYKVDIKDSAQLLNVEKNTVYQRRNIIKERLNITDKTKLEDWLSKYFDFNS